MLFYTRYNQEKLREEFNETREFLEMAIEDKKQFSIENEELRQRVKALEENVRKLQSVVAAMSNSMFLLDRYLHLCPGILMITLSYLL